MRMLLARERTVRLPLQGLATIVIVRFSPSRTSTQRLPKAIPYARHIGHITLSCKPFPFPLLNNYQSCIWHTSILTTVHCAQPSTAAAEQLHLQLCQPQLYPKPRLATRYSVLPSTDQVTCLLVAEEVPVNLLNPNLDFCTC